MQKPAIPKDEQTRLNVLKALEILDTPAEERFDRLTRIVQELFSVPIALITLVDRERQWFKSAIGLDATETPRDISFCAHTILGDDVLVVDDTKTDRRFYKNPMVRDEPGVRFYAGYPLRSIEGNKLGALALMDRKPRGFGEHHKQMLQDLAALVEREIQSSQLATVDELTLISNRRGFLALANKNMKLCQRKRMPASLVLIDLDQFEQINARHGQAAGDRALRLFADNMKNVARESDVVGRLAGDEFGILFADAEKDTARKIMTRFVSQLDSLCQQETLEFALPFSHGIVEYDPAQHADIGLLMIACGAILSKRKEIK